MAFHRLSKNPLWPAAWEFFSRSFVLLGLPLIAWGLDDLAGFFSNPARMTLAAVVVVQAFLHAWLGAITPPRPKPEVRVDLTHWYATLAELIYILAAFGDRRGLLVWDETQLVRWVGVGIYTLGAALSVWAHWTWVSYLRREDASAVDDPVLLCEGPFRWIRYPTLLSLLLYSLGAAFAFRSWLGLALLVPLAVAVVHRSQALDQRFAERYRVVWPRRSYRSKRIIPFVY